ncbi:4-amino-4-deoxy-L-arabinose transferase [Steroidobacter flavus]|uniref:4-amino-4-deoxy-L-arabinose transferase n=1 Tax=Steroidobacter flavus TaxID=1842136 RepID=A0ABV8T617_9GAMM
MNPVTWALVISGVLLNATAQLLLKAATSATGAIEPSWAGLATAGPRLLSHYGAWGGIACYVVSVVIWILALSRAPVSVVYPLLSIGYIVNAIAAAALFQESLAPGKLLGIAVIVLGVFILSQSQTQP